MVRSVSLVLLVTAPIFLCNFSEARTSLAVRQRDAGVRGSRRLKTQDSATRGLKSTKSEKVGDKQKKNSNADNKKAKGGQKGGKKGGSKGPSFDISDCVSYSDAWLFELAATCSNADTLTDCECPSAAALLESGALMCAEDVTSASACPSDCEVCQVCMEVSGCDSIYPRFI